MSPQELYEWAKENGCEEENMIFTVSVGNEDVELEISEIKRPTRTFNIYIDLY